MNQFELTLKLEEAKAAKTQKKLKEVYDSVRPNPWGFKNTIDETLLILKVAKEIHEMCKERITNMKSHDVSRVEHYLFELAEKDLVLINKILEEYQPPVRQFTAYYVKRESYNPMYDHRQPLFAKLMAAKAYLKGYGDEQT